MQVQPLVGRVFSSEEYGDKQGGYPVAVIGEGLWQRSFHSDPRVVGTTVRVNRQQLTIVGVVPRTFRGAIPGLAFDMWVPAMMATPLNLMPDWMLKDRGTRSFIAVARLQPGVSREQANAEIASVAQQLGRSYPQWNEKVGAMVLPLWQGHFGAQALLLEPLRILMAVGCVVLLIVCANVANLLLARSTARQREFSIRSAMGAGRGRLIRQMLTESLVLAFSGAVVGGSAGHVDGTEPGIPASAGHAADLAGCRNQRQYPGIYDTAVCAGVCNFGHRAGAATLQGGPGIVIARRRPEWSGGERVRMACVARWWLPRWRWRWWRLSARALFARSFQMTQRINPGFDPNQVVVSHLQLSSAGYAVPDRKLFCRRLREKLDSQPGVVASAYADILPLGMDSISWENLKVEGYVPGPAENMRIDRDVISPGYFSLLKIPLVAGRDFTEMDEEKSQQVMIVNEAFANRYFNGRDPIGRRVYGWGRWFTVVGVFARCQVQDAE